MLTFAREMETLTDAVSNHAADLELERKKARRTSRSYRLFTDNQERIFEYLQDQPPLPIHVIGQAVGLKRSTVYQHLQRLIALGRVRRIEAARTGTCSCANPRTFDERGRTNEQEAINNCCSRKPENMGVQLLRRSEILESVAHGWPRNRGGSKRDPGLDCKHRTDACVVLLPRRV